MRSIKGKSMDKQSLKTCMYVEDDSVRCFIDVQSIMLCPDSHGTSKCWGRGKGVREGGREGWWVGGRKKERKGGRKGVRGREGGREEM